MNKRQTILLSIIIVSILIGIFSLSKILKTGTAFSDSFNEINTPSELTIELKKGEYTFYELTTKSVLNKNFKIDYSITEHSENPKIIEIGVGSTKKNQSTTTYSLNDKQFKSIGKVLINKNQTVKIVSTIKDERIDKLAYRIKGDKNPIFDIMKYSLLLLISGGGLLISLIVLLINRQKG